MARSGHNFILQNVLSWLEDGDKIIHQNLENIKPKDLMPNHLKYGGHKLLIWRDFDDWMASSIMKAYKVQAIRNVSDMPSYIDRIVSGYNAIRQEALNPQYYRANAVIHYDEFVKSAPYRLGICHKLNGEYSEEKLNYVPPNGHHSSFDGDKFKNNGSKMNVLGRAKDILKTEYADFFTEVMQRYG